METTPGMKICEGGWMAALVEAVRDLHEEGVSPAADKVMEKLARRLGVRLEMAGALCASMDAVAEYALATVADDKDAVAEEDEAVAASRRAFRPLLEVRLQRRIDRVDAATTRAAGCPDCGAAGESLGRRRRTWQSTFGPVGLTRRWSECTVEKSGWSEAQRQLLLPDGDYTPRLEEAVTLMATVTPHGTAGRLCERLLGVSVSVHAVESAVERRAAAVVALQDAEAAQFVPWEENGLARATGRPPGAETKPPQVAYVEVDGVVPMTRTLDPERSQPVAGKRGGKGRRYTMEGKEVKNAVLYRGDDCMTEGDGRGVVLEKRYVSCLGHWLNFAALLWTLMLRLGFDRAATLVLLSDGALWIRDLAKWFPCQCLLILDLFHAKHRVWEVANALFGEHSPEARLWANTQCVYIEKGEVWSVLDTLKELRPRSKATRTKVKELITYFTNNKDRMDYPAYRAAGYRVSSGGVESANYHVTGARLKMQGMRWSEKGAAEMARLRTDLANDVWRQRTREVLRA